jgi:hypothetical protein
MQEQCEFFEAIQFGTMDANCASPGIQNNAKNLNQIDPVFIHKSHIQISAQNDELCALSHIDTLQKGVAPGSMGVGIGALCQHPAIGQGLPVAESGPHAASSRSPPRRQSSPGGAEAVCPGASPQVGGREEASCMRVVASGHREAAGFSTPNGFASPAAVALSETQKIQQESSQPGRGTPGEAHLRPMIGNHAAGSAVPHVAVARGELAAGTFANNLDALHFDFSQRCDHVLSVDFIHTEVTSGNAGVGSSASLGQSKGGTNGEAMAKGVGSSIGMNESMGVASSLVSSGKPLHHPGSSLVKEKSSVSLSVIENSIDNLAVRPTMEEVIAFGEFRSLRLV